MRFKNLDLNLLVVLDTLLKQQSVTKTAEQLMLSPSAVSSSLSRLRDYFGDELLSQVGRKMEITPRAESLQDPVRDILSRIDSTILLQPVFEPHKTDRTFSIFVSDYTQLVLFPHLLALAEEQSSTARFNFLRQINTPHKDLERGEADLLIIPEEFVSPYNPYENLFTEDFVCLVWDQSKFAQQPLTQEIYLDARHIVMCLADDRKDHIELVLTKKYDVQRDVAVTSYSLTSLPALLIGTNNIATIHARLAKKMVGVLPLEIKPLPFDIGTMRQSIQWHQYRSKDPGLIWLRELLKSATERMDNDTDKLFR